MLNNEVIDGSLFNPNVRSVIINDDIYKFDVANVTVVFKNGKYLSLAVCKNMFLDQRGQIEHMGRIISDQITCHLIDLTSDSLDKIEAYINSRSEIK